MPVKHKKDRKQFIINTKLKPFRNNISVEVFPGSPSDDGGGEEVGGVSCSQSSDNRL